MLQFEWDQAKAKANFKKHGISFDEGETVFDDPLSVTIPDSEHSLDEPRFIDIGISIKERILVVVYTERKSKIRLISCRKATAWERAMYEKSERYD